MRSLAGTDCSTGSQRALRRAGILAREARAELVLLHVVTGARAASADLDVREAQRISAEQVLSVPELAGVRCRAIVTGGDPADAILEQP